MLSENIKNQAILLVTDKDSPVIIDQYNALKKATEKYADVFIAYHQKETQKLSYVNNADYYLFSNSILTELGYNPLGPSLVPGNNHYPLLKFYRENPGYDYYWVIEDDVRFSGDWALLFDSFINHSADFITCTIRHWIEEPTWGWWRLEHKSKEIPLEKRIKSFNPIYRISNSALDFLNKVLLDGWWGHHEVLMPTMLKNGGYEIADFGGVSKYTPKGFVKKFYTANKWDKEGLMTYGTMRWKPVFDSVGLEPDKLYHPVKDFYPKRDAF